MKLHNLTVGLPNFEGNELLGSLFAVIKFCSTEAYETC